MLHACVLLYGIVIDSYSHHFLKLLVPCLYEAYDPGVGVENDQHREVEGSAGGVDHVADVLVVPAVLFVDPVAIGLGPEREMQKVTPGGDLIRSRKG